MTGRSFNWRVATAMMLATIWQLLPQGGLAQDEADPITDPVERLPFTLTLVDEKQQPVPGTKVTAAGLRCEESPGSWLSWPTKNAGKNEYVTNEKGEVVAFYPVKFGAPGQWMTTNKIDFFFQHPDFVAGRIEVDPSTKNATHSLTEGCRAVFTCVDENGKSIQDFAVRMAGAGGDATWKRHDGEVRSNGIPDGAWQTMLVAPKPNGEHLFTGVLPARYAKGKDVTIRGAKLLPGLRLSGSLSDNVPRPIMDGRVVAWCLPKPRGNTWGEGEASIGWSEFTSIAEDGTFEFPSLPRGGTIQLIALCRGWLIHTDLVENEKANHGLTMGKEVKVDELKVADNRLAGITLQMEPAGQLAVEVVGPDGNPLEGVTVSTWPNQKLTLNGTQILGECYPTIDTIRALIDPSIQLPNAWNMDRIGRYNQRTDKFGKATLREIPIGKNQSLFLGYKNHRPDRERPADAGNIFADEISYICKSSELQTLKVKMVPIGAEKTDSR